MKLYIIRHAEAVDGSPDAGRQLSANGRDQVRDLVHFFRKNGRLVPAAAWHSPLSRAIETATLFSRGLGWKFPIEQVPGLEPEDDPAEIAGRLEGGIRDVAIFGHEPHLSALASLLLSGHASPPIVMLKKGACLALEGDSGFWSVRWLVVPGLLR